MWLSFGWIPPILVRISIFFNSVITAFVGLPLEIALMSLYRCIPCSMGIISAIADRASCETVLQAFVIKMRKDL